MPLYGPNPSLMPAPESDPSQTPGFEMIPIIPESDPSFTSNALAGLRLRMGENRRQAEEEEEQRRIDALFATNPLPPGRVFVDESNIPHGATITDVGQSSQQLNMLLNMLPPPAAQAAARKGTGMGPMSSTYRAMKGARYKYSKQEKDAARRLKDAQGKQIVAMQETADIQAKSAKDTAAAMRGRNQAAQEIWSEESRVVGDARKAVDDSMTRYQEASDKYAAMKVDPNRRMANTSTGNKIMAAIAVALYELGSKGGPNQAMQIIQTAIDRDIQAQMAAIDQQGKTAMMANTAYGMARQIFGDADTARTAAYNMTLREYQNKIEMLAAESKEPEVVARAQELTAGLQAQQSQSESKMVGDQYRIKLQGLTAEMGAAGTMLGAADKATQGAKGKTLPAAALTKLSEYAGAESMIDTVKKAWKAEMAGNYTAFVTQYAPWATDARKFKEMVPMAAQMLGKRLEGRMTDEDYGRFLSMMPQASDTTGIAMAKMNAMKKFLQGLNSSMVKVYGQAGFDTSGFAGGQATSLRQLERRK